LKRFEPAIYRFTKIAVPTDLDRLERHKYNIEKVMDVPTSDVEVDVPIPSAPLVID
jgi:hypothetical protein